MKLLGLSLLFMGLTAAAGMNPCPMQTASEPLVRADNHRYNSIAELDARFEAVNAGGERLKGRAGWDPVRSAYVLSTDDGPVPVAPVFIESLTREINLAFALGYVDDLVYADLGHAHLLLPINEANALNRIGDRALVLERVLASPNLKMLFHTAELLVLRSGTMGDGPLPQDAWLGWRYFARNFVGENTGDSTGLSILYNNGPGYNTVRSLDGYQEMKVIYLSPSTQGCFPFHRQAGRTDTFFDFTSSIIPGALSRIRR